MAIYTSESKHIYDTLGVNKALLDKNYNAEFVESKHAAEAFSSPTAGYTQDELADYLRQLTQLFNQEGKRWWREKFFQSTGCLSLVPEDGNDLELKPEVAAEEFYFHAESSGGDWRKLSIVLEPEEAEAVAGTQFVLRALTARLAEVLLKRPCAGTDSDAQLSQVVPYDAETWFAGLYMSLAYGCNRFMVILHGVDLKEVRSIGLLVNSLAQKVRSCKGLVAPAVFTFLISGPGAVEAKNHMETAMPVSELFFSLAATKAVEVR